MEDWREYDDIGARNKQSQQGEISFFKGIGENKFLQELFLCFVIKTVSFAEILKTEMQGSLW